MLQSKPLEASTSGPDILLIGHVTCDLVSADRDSDYRLGGTVSFASVTAIRLGRRASVITRAAATTDLSELPAEVDLHVLPSPETTTFANVYTEHGRIQYCYAQALPITAGDIAPGMRAPRAVLIGPLVNEIGPDVVRIFDKQTLVVAVPRLDAPLDDTGRAYSKPWTRRRRYCPIWMCWFCHSKTSTTTSAVSPLRWSKCPWSC